VAAATSGRFFFARPTRLERLLKAAEAIDRLLAKAGFAAGWLFFADVGVICFDVVTRKFGYQVPGFGSTRLQELEWHLHAAIFAFWLGVAYVRNAHVRIDTFTAGMRPRAHAWLELLGSFLFALPYCLVGLYFSAEYTWTAWARNEASESLSGLPYRFIPKGLIAAAFLLLVVATLSVAMRTGVYLFGPERLRERAAFAGARRRKGAVG
jgi:TRAP-type mannitol/chloroaromatic compound transport system permease small subunit